MLATERFVVEIDDIAREQVTPYDDVDRYTYPTHITLCDNTSSLYR
jgi:hypothetical protein